MSINGGGGSSHNFWPNTGVGGVPTVPNFAEGCHDARMVGGEIRYRWQFANRGVRPEVGLARTDRLASSTITFMGTSTINLTDALSRTETVKHVLDMATARVNNRWGGPVIAKS